jgi:hyaluronoglucosaminidase
MYSEERNWVAILLCVLFSSVLGLLVASLIGCDGIGGSWKVDVEEKDNGGAKVEVTPIEPEEPKEPEEPEFKLVMRYLWGNIAKEDNIERYRDKFEYWDYGYSLNYCFVGLAGDWPYYDYSGNAKNGGIPQKVDLEKHFTKLEKDLEYIMPDKDVEVYAVFDFEYWSPYASADWAYVKEIYKEKSIEHVLKKYNITPNHPEWQKYHDSQLIQDEAKREFLKAGINILVKSLQKAKELRPKAKWGYYGYPARCYWSGIKSLPGYNAKLKKVNDEIKAVYDASDAIYPSFYIHHRYASKPDTTMGGMPTFDFNKEWQRQNAEEVVRISQGKPIFAYIWYGYAPGCNPLISEQDYELTLKSCMEGGLDGVILWMHTYNDSELTRIGEFYENVGGAIHRKLSLIK